MNGMHGAVEDYLTMRRALGFKLADHGYRVLKRSRARTDSVFDEMAEAARAFVDAHPALKAR